MINVIATIAIKPGSRPQFISVINELVPTVRSEEGCIEYFPAIDVDANLESQNKNENTVIMIEKWESLEALHAHLAAPHMIAFRDNAGDMLQGLTLKILEQA